MSTAASAVAIFYYAETHAASAVASVVRERLGEHALAEVAGETPLSCAAAALVFVVECEPDGSPCAAARKFMRELKKAGATPLAGKKVAVLALARSVCAFSAAQGGSDKFAGGAKVQKALSEVGGCEGSLVKMGSAEVEQEEVDVVVVPWADSLRAALEGRGGGEEARSASASAPLVTIFHGSDLSAEIAELTRTRASKLGIDARLVSLGTWKRGLESSTAAGGGLEEATAIFCVATVENEAPDEEAGACVRWLSRRTHAADALRGLRFCVLGLGDSNLLLDRQTTTAADCNQVAQKVDARLEALGATRFYARGEADDRTGNLEIEPWLDGLWGALAAASSAPLQGEPLEGAASPSGAREAPKHEVEDQEAHAAAAPAVVPAAAAAAGPSSSHSLGAHHCAAIAVVVAAVAALGIAVGAVRRRG